MASVLRQQAHEAVNLTPHLLGTLITWTIVPILNASLLAEVSLADKNSALFLLTLSYSISNEADFIIGASAGIGPGLDTEGLFPVLQSEFGANPRLIYG